MEDDDEDFEELFSFAAASPQPAEKTSPSSVATSSDFDMINDDSPDENARTSSCSAALPSSGATRSEFDDLFGSPPKSSRESSATSPVAKATREVDPTSFNLVSDALDGFHVHDEDTRDFLDWLDDDTTGRKQNQTDDGPSKTVVNQNETDSIAVDADDDDDFDFDKMLLEVGVETAPIGTTKPAMAQSKGITNAQKEVGQVKKISLPQPQQKKNEPKKGTPAPPAAPPSAETTPLTQQPDLPSTGSVSKVSDITAPPTDAAKNDVALESKTEVERDILPVMTDTTNNKEPIIKSNDNEAKENKTPGSAVPLDRPSVEDELSYQQWNDDNEEDDAEITDIDERREGSTDEGLSMMGKIDTVVVEKKAIFSSLSDAIRSNASSIEDVRMLFDREIGTGGSCSLSSEDRAHLWTKVICGKILEDVDNGSLADSFREWQNNNTAVDSDEKCMSMFDALITNASLIEKDNEMYETTRERLLSVLNFHCQGKDSSAVKTDPLLPPVALAILQTGMPLAVASVVLSQIEPKAMPLMRLSNAERILASKALHTDFHLLACYHLPLLMMHLDRNCQGWYWPKKEEENPVEEDASQDNAVVSDDHETKGDGAKSVKENKKAEIESYGLMPPSWFVTNFAGECDEACLNHTNLLPLWDHILTTGDSSWKFFLAVAALERRSDVLLMVTGEELRRELEEVFRLKETPVDSFVGSSERGVSDHLVPEWLSLSKSLIECTPSSVNELLRSADDRAVGNAIKLRQIQMEEELKAQAAAHELAMKKEREERDAEEKNFMIKARLTAYYRTHNPEKVDTIDQILKLFDGRIEVLNEKLKKKYGSGFLPDEAPINQVSNQTLNFFMSVNQSINDTRKHVAETVKERRKKSSKDETNLKSHVSVALEVSPTEVIPHICSKKLAINTRFPNSDGTLNFYLIDCRPESIASEQGRFPKAINMSPEKLQDPEELQRLIEMFEQLRGAVHICVMGEGFASFPVLYNHPLTKDEQKLLENDISRTSSCALFFLKKGFPFVSLLKGGFAAAHAFLSRSGTPGMTPTEVLIDYDPDVSLFAQLETARQEQELYKSAPAREKVTRSVQRIIDNSMIRLTLAEQRINSSAAGLSSPENVAKVKQSVSGLTRQMPSVSFGRTPPLFMSKKFAPADEGIDKQKSVTNDENEKDKATLTEKLHNFRLPSLKSDISSRHTSEANINAAHCAAEDGESQEKADEGSSDTQPSFSTTFSSFTQRMEQNLLDGSPSHLADSSKESVARETRLPKIQLDQAKNSLSSLANLIKTADDSKGKPAESAIATAKEEGPSKISASLSSFATRIKASAAATGSTDVDDPEKALTSNVSSSLSSFANKLKSTAANMTGKSAVTEGSLEEKSSSSPEKRSGSISNPFSSFSLKRTTPGGMTPKSDQNNPEESTFFSEKLGWLMRDDPPGESFSQSKVDLNQSIASSETKGDESLLLDVEEVNFD